MQKETVALRFPSQEAAASFSFSSVFSCPLFFFSSSSPGAALRRIYLTSAQENQCTVQIQHSVSQASPSPFFILWSFYRKAFRFSLNRN